MSNSTLTLFELSIKEKLDLEAIKEIAETFFDITEESIGDLIKDIENDNIPIGISLHGDTNDEYATFVEGWSRMKFDNLTLLNFAITVANKFKTEVLVANPFDTNHAFINCTSQSLTFKHES